MFVRIAWSCPTYIYPWLYGLVCLVQINARLQVDLHLTLSLSSETFETKMTTRMPEGARRERLFSSRAAALVFRVSQLHCSTLTRGNSSH